MEVEFEGALYARAGPVLVEEIEVSAGSYWDW
jgi:hypothetical protein